MESKTINQLYEEVFEHLWKGRFRMALPLAEQLYKNHDSKDSRIIFCWALLENGKAAEAKYFYDLTSKMDGQSSLSDLILGYIQLRFSYFEEAVYNFNMTSGRHKEMLAWTYLNKAKALASLKEVEKANNFFELALMIDNKANPNWKNLRKYFNSIEKIVKHDLSKLNISEIKTLAEEAFKEKEYWFTLVATNIIKDVNLSEDERNSIVLLELEAMLKMNQIDLIEENIKKFIPTIENSQRFDALKKIFENAKIKPTIEEFKTDEKETTFYSNNFLEIKNLSIYDATNDIDNANNKNYSELDSQKVNNIGIQIIANNPSFNIIDTKLNCLLAWYSDEELFYQTTFELTIPKDWDMVLIKEFCDLKANNFWKNGDVVVELYANKTKIFDYKFIIGDRFVEKKNMETSNEKPIEDKEESIQKVLTELDEITGLKNVKQTVRDLIDYLEFMGERKKQGLAAEDKISVHTTFIGNPGTGKTTVARLMGRIFKTMGLLPKGEVIEVDRYSLVGQYVGETAQKTEKIIEEAMGNVLFIDEAYTLVKKGAQNDFGQEAIDILLKRMEDKKGEFFVIAAGYPNEMNDFLGANPGLKSRFTHNFLFEDYEPNELMEIFEKLVNKEEYRLTNPAKIILQKEIVNLYRSRDKNFGNARTIRKMFEDAKMAVSHSYLSLPISQRSKDALVTIDEEQIKEILKTNQSDKTSFTIPINQELLNNSLMELNRFIGLKSVKKEISELVELVKYYRESGEDIKTKFSSHILFLGNPGTGKTTIARIIAKIYSALGILESGQLIETDRKGLVASYIGQTAEKTTEVVNSAIGGTLFIDEAYTLVGESGSDFGQEALDTLLKRMEDDRGKFICIAAGYTNEMKNFLESNPGMKSRFNKTFFFEDYTPDEMIEIFAKLAEKEKVIYSDKTLEMVKKHFNELYRNRDKNFGNARIVRNFFEEIVNSHNLRISKNIQTISIEMRNWLLEEDLPFLNLEIVSKKSVAGDSTKLLQYLDELNNMTGLSSVKEQITKHVNGIKISNLRKERGMEVLQKPLHLVFTGNPGTGKTTIARLVSNIFKELGIIEKGHLVEVDRAQLVAGYSGQTAIKTDQIINSAIGGTLFIDEAYTLSRGSNDFGQEAIDTLLKRMEDYKDKLIVIVAGYTNEMKHFLESNPGLTSRFVNVIEFEDYRPDELLLIIDKIAKSNNYKFENDAKSKLIIILDELYNNRDKNFGNARMAKNIFHNSISNQENRISSILNPTDEQLALIIEEDISYL